MRFTVNLLVMLAVQSLLVTATAANLRWEFGERTVYTNNLFHAVDTATDRATEGVVDRYITANSEIKFYPLKFVELNLNGEVSAYSETKGFDPGVAGVGLTVVPTREMTPLTLYFSGSFDGRRYGDRFGQFDVNTLSLKAAAGYWVNQVARLRFGLAYSDNAYLATDADDRTSYQFSTGVNFSVLGSNAIDIEVGVVTARYTFLPSDENEIIDRYLKLVTFADGDLVQYWISPRFSRPIGPRSGLSVTFTYQEFPSLEDGVVLGSGFESLSPWASIWRGRGVQVDFKSYAVPHMIVTAGVGYRDKSTLRIHEGESLMREVIARYDEETKLNLNLQRPIVWKSGLIGEPSLNIEWTNNVSSKRQYDYSGLMVSVGLKFKL